MRGRTAPHQARGDEITLLVMTTGEEGRQDARARIREQEDAAAILGARVFAFAYTLSGYLLMLFLLLPKGTAAARYTEPTGAPTPVNHTITTIRGATVATPARERWRAHRVSV